ncbi:MAG: FhaA domain-containing protein [Pseudonocardiaceae bacterium]
MGKVQRFERRLQGMVGDAFARVFGGNVVPQEVAQALQREADDNARPLAGGRVLAPNRYTVTLGATDHDRLAGDEQRVIRMLKNCIQGHLAEQSWDTYGDVVVALKRSESLHTGQFRTSSSVDPDAPQPRTAGDRAMSQQQGEHPEEGQRGWYGPQRGYGHEQGQGGHDANPHYGQPYGHELQYAQDQDHPPNQHYGDQNYRGQGGGHYGYDQGRGGYAPGYDQEGYGYGQGNHGPDQGGRSYGDQNYGQYGGAQPGYGYEQGSYGVDQSYGADQGYPTQGYLPPAVQTGPRQLTASLILDDGSNRQYQLIEGATVVGRGQDAQFRLPDTGVSRRHLEINWDGWTATLADLGSTNGTTVNGTPVQTWQLADGDVVRVGHSSLVFRTQG